ncbi:phosphotransferase enzyme family protein [Actinomadura parmotrematis]|uniref:Aminoglycoside phosphotransferase family protein n=1 Tax=Actinomadura parmotrematis TaxID=2864039 RepID=A0ABS7FV18_9ACTN|nr:phosphotransferase [Actinomadura parmotrematis]MBW8484265.1 aminoglycoside phosphotransferase family protein [Actinomadura parmotrematis]
MAASIEIPLSGGDVTEGVVRVGDTVRRPLGPQSPAVHGLLRHLEDVGFDGAPRVLGVDGRGREVLSWVPGETPRRPLPAYAVSDEALAGVARLLRRYHDAVEGYGLAEGAPWDTAASNLDGEPELIGHCDVTPENVVFRGGVVCGLIDFDLARPTTRLYDVVTALRHWAPVADPADRDWRLYGVDVGRRMRLFSDAYGLDRATRGELLTASRVRFERSYRAMEWRAEQYGGGWARMWHGGAGARIRRAQDWLERNWDELDACL